MRRYRTRGVIEIELDGARLVLKGTVDAEALRVVLSVLVGDDRAALGHTGMGSSRVTDMRKGMDGLAALVQTTLAENPFLCGEQ